MHLISQHTDVLAAFLAFRYSSWYLHFSTVSMPYVSLLLHCLHHPTIKFLCAVDTNLVSIHISHLQLRESHLSYIPKRSPLLQESVDISLTLPAQIPFARQYLSTFKFSFLVEYVWF